MSLVGLPDRLREARPRGDELRRLATWARPERGALGLGLVLMVLYSALGLLVPLALAWMMDALGRGEASGPIVDALVMGLLGLFLLRAGLGGLHGWWMARIGGRIVLRMRAALFAKLCEQGPEFYDDERVGGLVSRMMSDVAQVQGVLTGELSRGVSALLTLFGAALLMVWGSWRLSLVFLMLVPPVVLAGWWHGRWMRRRGEAVQERTAELSSRVEETLGAIRLVQAFGRESLVRSRFDAAAEALYHAVMRRVRGQSVMGSAVGFLGLAAMTLGLWLGAREVQAQRMTVGTLTGFLLYAGLLAGAASQLVGLVGSWANALGAGRRVFELLDRRPRVVSGERRMMRCEGALRFEGLRFGYRPGLPVLRGIDLDVPAGEQLALVGPSGAGKSTLMQLVARFRDPDDGRIRLDGIDLRELDLGDLRRQIGWVPQEAQLFHASVEENLRFGRPDASMDRIEAAARAANAEDFIRALPEGYATLVGERGLRLSTGQRQRIAIARALLADPRLLLLDEATASLDSESEAQVQEAMARLLRGRTSLIIAHRLATVRDADRIAVLDEGRVVELGRHEDLSSAGGLYAMLCRLQLRA